MAKDKSKKADAASADSFGKPSEAKGGGDGWRFESEDNVGSLFLITPLREEDFMSEDYGATKVIVAEIVELNEKKPAKSVVHEDAYIFGGWTKGAVRGYIGERKVLGRLGQDQSKSKSQKNPAWVLEDADKDDTEVGLAYLASIDPFAQKGAKGKGDDTTKGKASKDEKPAKKKSKK